MASKLEIIQTGMNLWAMYFRRKINHEVVELYQKIMVPYSPKAINSCFNYFNENGQRFPFIFEVKQYLSNLEQFELEYDRVEDLRFPVRRLLKAFQILTKHGKQSFVNYCDSVKMPLNDRERVILKAEYAFRDEPKTLEIINGIASKYDVSGHQRGYHTHPHHGEMT